MSRQISLRVYRGLELKKEIKTMKSHSFPNPHLKHLGISHSNKIKSLPLLKMVHELKILFIVFQK